MAHLPYIGSRRLFLPISGLIVLATASALTTRCFWNGRPLPATHRTGIHNDPPTTDDDQLLLPQSERQLIWEVEDRAFQLGKKVLEDWDRALRQGTTDPLRDAIAADFRGRWLVAESRSPAQFAAFEFDQMDAKNAQVEARDGKEFIAEVMRLRAEYQEVSTAHWSVKSLRPDDRDNILSTSWRARLQLELRGTSTSGTLAESVLSCQVSTTVLPQDLTGLKHWLTSAEVVAIRRLRGGASSGQPRPLMENVTDTCGYGSSLFHDNWTTGVYEQVTGGVYVTDYDRDGWLDFLVTDVRRFGLFRAVGSGRFEETTAEAGLPTELGPRQVFAIFSDFDNDGYDDLVLGTRIYRNERNGHFKDVTLQSHLVLPPDVNNLSVADYDCDGLVDLYACIARPEPGQTVKHGWLDVQTVQPNRLWRNLGDFRFVDVTEPSGSGDRGRSFAAVWFHYNDDRFPDLFVANEIGQNALYVNSGKGSFERIDIDGDRFGGFSMGVDVGDVNNDGRQDLYVANMYSKAGNRIIENLTAASYPPGIFDKVRDFCTGNRLYLGRAEGGFNEVGPSARVAEAGWAYGTRAVDLDGDGWLDLYATAGQQSFSRDDPDG